MWIRFYLPALFYLILTAATGCLLRLQWTAPEYSFFNAQNLIHAHSHIALLGWIFLVLCGLLFEYGMKKEALRHSRRTAFGILIQITVIGMLVSFALQGYAPASIAFSSIHIFLSYYFAALYFRNERMGINPVVRNFYNAAVLWMVLSSFGPWLLAAGGGITPFWMDTAISFYLHLQFNGWFIFFLSGFTYHFLINRHFRSQPKWGNLPFAFMFLGLTPSLIPILDDSNTGFWLVMAGSAGTLAFTAGSAMVLWLAWQSRTVLAGQRGSGLFWFAFLAGGIKTLMQAATVFPQAVTIFLPAHYIVIGFIHLLLLGFISTALLYIIALKRNREMHAMVWRAGSISFQTGTAAMLVLLFGIGLMQITGQVVYFQFQLWLLAAGILVLGGVMVMTGSIIRTKPVWSTKTKFNTLKKADTIEINNYQ